MNDHYRDEPSPAPPRRRRGPFGRQQSVSASGGLGQSTTGQRALRAASWLAMIVTMGVLLLVATATVPVLFGYHNYRVNGASMEPSLGKGSVAVTRPTSPRALEVGDIIAYRSSAEVKPVLHRIIEITTADGELRFITQGDQNQAPDPTPVTLTGDGDKVVYSVPYAGYVLNVASSMPGQALLIGVPLLSLAGIFMRDASRRRKGPAEQAASQHTPPAFPPPVTPETEFGPRPAPWQAPPATAPAAPTIARLITATLATQKVRLHEMPLLKVVPLATGPVPLAVALDMAFTQQELASAGRQLERQAA